MRRELTQEKGNAVRKETEESGGDLEGNSVCWVLGTCMLSAEITQELPYAWETGSFLSVPPSAL